MFVTVDGPNGVGKSSMLAALALRLRAEGKDIVEVRQPSSSELGVFARSSEHSLGGMALAVLVVADRYMLVENTIKPALARGQSVLCDRHVASTLALQRLDGLPMEVTWPMNEQVLVPNLSVLLTAAPATLKQRLDRRGRTSRFESASGNEAREVTYFAEAFELLRSKGYETATVSTEECSPAQAAAAVLAMLESMRAGRSQSSD